MKNLIIVANWKAQKTSKEVKNWLEKFLTNNKQQTTNNNKEIIICPPFQLLPILKEEIGRLKLPIEIGAQDLSPFPKGAYTGEIAAEQLIEYVSYVIIGHSERRKYFYENEQMLANKVDMALENNINPIYCVQDEKEDIPKDVKIIAYEPVFAIGTGNPDTPESADEVAKTLKQKYPFVKYVLYGGSVTAENVHSFTSITNIDGVLVGGGSLDPVVFCRIITSS